MTPEDKEMLKNIYTAFAMLGYISAGSPTFSIPEKSNDMVFSTPSTIIVSVLLKLFGL